MADPTDLLFSEPMTETEAIPVPQLLMEVIQRQWASGTYPTSFDKKLYNGTPDITELLQTPDVDELVMALVSPQQLS